MGYGSQDDGYFELWCTHYLQLQVEAIAGLDVNRYDAVINEVAITDARKVKYDFSTPYIASHAALIVRADNTTIKTFADLKGKLIGLSLPIDTISVSMRKLLALKGLGQDDYRVKELVGSPVRAACLKSGECDAVPLGQPDDLIAVKNGYRRLGLSTEAVASFQFEVIAARRDFAETHAPALIGFVSALADAFRFIRDPAHRDDAVNAIVALTGASDYIARATLALYLDPDRGVLPQHAEIDLGGLAQVIAFTGEGGTIKPPLPAPEQFVDLQYLRAAGAQ